MKPLPPEAPALPARKIEVEISVKTLAKLLAVALIVYAMFALGSLLVTLFFATMLAVTIYPLQVFLRRRGFPSWVGVGIVCGVLVLAAALFATVVLPPLATQTGTLLETLPKARQIILDHLAANPVLSKLVEKALGNSTLPSASSLLSPLLSVGAVAAAGVTQILLMLIFTVYLLVDGARTAQWILDFFGAPRRARLTQTADEMSKVISAYVAGQLITSLICGVYTLVVLLLLGVPSALPLAVLAGIFDVLPVLGFVLAGVPAVLLALTISPLTAVLVVVLYVIYHGLENYLLVPKIYGNRLRLSDLVVLISLLAAGSLAGVLGAIAVLPLVASYPIVERIWLVDYLGRKVVRKHATTGQA